MCSFVRVGSILKHTVVIISTFTIVKGDILVRCEEFYEKWKRDPNWCKKCPTAVFYIDRYIELTQRYPSLRKISEGAARPLLSIPLEDKDFPTIATIITYEHDMGKKVTADLVKEIIQKVKGKEKAPIQKPEQPKYKDVLDKLEPYYPLDVLDAVGSRVPGKITLKRWKRLLKSFIASMWKIVSQDRELMVKLLKVWEEGR